MYVREAEIEDILPIISMLKGFAEDTGIENAPEYFSPRAVGAMVSYSILNGCCLVAVSGKEEELVGIMMGSISVNPWTSSTRELREQAWYVKPEHRKTKAGIKLYNRYTKESRQMIEDGEVVASFMTTLENSGKLVEDLVSRDFKRMETHYIMGG